MRPPEFWSQADSAVGYVLTPASWLWRAATSARRSLTRPVTVEAPVICVGNLTAGGAGKTPISMDIARRLNKRGRTPHILGRGYGGALWGTVRVDPARHDAGQVGDEALLLAAAAPVWIGGDRRAGAVRAVEAGADVLVLDDGYQNPGLKKNLSLLVIDGGFGFGNGRVMPAGPLRESAAAGLGRADAVVILGRDEAGIAEVVSSELPLLHAVLEPEAADRKALAGQRLLAFCGIGRPAKFRVSLEAMDCRIAEFHAFADHHPYRRREIETLLEQARRLGVPAVTTEKDAVRLPVDLRRHVKVLRVNVAWREPNRLDALLSGLTAG